MTPPMPSRLPPHAGLLRRLLAGWDNTLSAWDRGAYVQPLVEGRLPGRRLLVLNHPRWVRQVLATRADDYVKGADMRRMLRPLVGDSLLLGEGARWRRRRHLIAPALVHRRQLPVLADAMREPLRRALERWLSRGDGWIELGLEATRVAADVVGHTLFSFPLADWAETLHAAFGDYQDTRGRMDPLGLLGLPDWLPRPGDARARTAVERLEEIVDAVIAARAGREGMHGDLLDRILEAGQRGAAAPQSRQLARDEVMLVLLAGHETTANALCWACYLLATHPVARGRLEREVDRVLGRREPAPDDLPRLPWLQAVIRETLRLYPPIHQFSREPLAPERVAGRDLPTGSLVVISPWLLHRHHRYWREPDAFRPERFLEPGGGPRFRYAYLPFGAGPRICPGAAFATTELGLLLAMMAQRLRLELRPGHPVEPLGRLTLRPRWGLPMRVVRRDR